MKESRSTKDSQSGGNRCSVSLAAAPAALNGGQAFVAESARVCCGRRDATLARIKPSRRRLLGFYPCADLQKPA